MEYLACGGFVVLFICIIDVLTSFVISSRRFLLLSFIGFNVGILARFIYVYLG